MAYVSYESGLPMASLSTRGDFELRQKYPIEIKKTTTVLYDEEKLLDDKSPMFKNNVIDLTSMVMNRYAHRDYSADYKPRYISSTRGALSSQSLSGVNASEDGDRPYFSYTMIIDIPTQEISFIPTFSDVIKDAWIKYLSIFILLCLLLRELCSFVYRNQM